MAKKPPIFHRFDQFVRAACDERTVWSSPGLSRLHKFAHFWVLVGKSFARNRCPVRASALAYATLLALIPMLAVAVSITSSFLKREGEQQIDQFIATLVASVTQSAALDPKSANAPLPQPADADASVSPDDEPGAALSPAPTNAVANTNSPAVRPDIFLPAFAHEEDAVKMRKEVAKRIHGFIQNTRSGALGVTGTVLLIFAAISMLSRIESTFNDIWGVERGRGWFTRVVLYWGVLSLAPMLLVVALGLISGSHLDSVRKLVTHMPFSATLFSQFMPLVLLCLAFSAFYILMPNTRVRWGAALAGGFVGGALWHLNSLASVLFVSRVVSNSKIYGSLALVPVLMIGLYFSWLILLFGAQVAYAFQNRKTYFEEKQVDQINQRGREFIALRLMTCVGQRFVRGEPPPNALEIGAELGVPTRLTRQLMSTLGAARLVVESAGSEPAFLPARPLETITCHDILQALRTGQGQELARHDEPVTREVYGEYNRIEDAERQAASSVTMLALVNRAEGRKVERIVGVIE